MIKVNKTVLKGRKFIDLFCGIGGFHLALSSFGAECVFASDIDKYACEIYNKNFAIQPEGDIKNILAKEIPKHDILCGGFPCQPFSISGNQGGFNDTRGTLFFEMLRIIEHHKPPLILLENVKNIVTHNKGKTLETILNKLGDLGYNVHWETISGIHFNIPQNRERVYFVASLKEIDFKFPTHLKLQKSVKNILEKDVNDSYFTDRIPTFTQEYESKTISKKPRKVGYIGNGGQGERIYSIYGSAITLSASGGGIGAKTGLYYVDGRVRKLTPNECKDLMGFPKTFQIAETASQACKQFGNSVIVNIPQHIMKQVIKQKML